MDQLIIDSSFDLPFDDATIIYVVWHRGSRIQFNVSGDALFVGSRYNDSLCFATSSKAIADDFIKDKRDYFYKQILFYHG